MGREGLLLAAVRSEMDHWSCMLPGRAVVNDEHAACACGDGCFVWSSCAHMPSRLSQLCGTWRCVGEGILSTKVLGKFTWSTIRLTLNDLHRDIRMFCCGDKRTYEQQHFHIPTASLWHELYLHPFRRWLITLLPCFWNIVRKRFTQKIPVHQVRNNAG